MFTNSRPFRGRTRKGEKGTRYLNGPSGSPERKALPRYLGDIPTVIPTVVPINLEAADSDTREGFLWSGTRCHSLMTVGNFGRRPERMTRLFQLRLTISCIYLKTVELAGVTANSPFAFGANINKSEHDRWALEDFRWNDLLIRS